jgi:hypothetical protein
MDKLMDKLMDKHLMVSDIVHARIKQASKELRIPMNVLMDRVITDALDALDGRSFVYSPKTKTITTTPRPKNWIAGLLSSVLSRLHKVRTGP